MLYQSKDLADVKTAIRLYIENYESRTGIKFDKVEANHLELLFMQEIDSKTREMFKDIFGTYTVKSLRDAVSVLKELSKPSEDT